MRQYKYIIVSGGNHYNNLGHELFWTRKIVLLLLYYNLIDKNSTIVTCHKDRFILYKKYFRNGFVYNPSIENIRNKNDVLDLRQYLNTVTNEVIEPLKNLGLHGNLADNSIFQNTDNNEINKFMCNLDFNDNLEEFGNILDSKFFVIHIRPTCKYVEYLLDFIKFSNINAIIFTNKDINYQYKTDKLQTYASLLNHHNCIGLIGEWSGGTQLGQFCCKKIIFYYDHYPSDYNDNNKKNYEMNNNMVFHNNWDHYNPFKTEKYFLETSNFLDMNKLISFIN